MSVAALTDFSLSPPGAFQRSERPNIRAVKASSVHVGTPLCDDDLEGERPMKHRGLTTLPGATPPLSHEEFNAQLSAALQEADLPAKVVGRIVETPHEPAKSHRHAEKWLAGERAPTSFDLIRLAIEVPAVKRWVARILQLEAECLHYEAARTIADFMRIAPDLLTTLERSREVRADSRALIERGNRK